MRLPTTHSRWRHVTSALLVLLLAACGGGDADRPLYELKGAAMGTTWSVKVVDLPDGPVRGDLRDEVESTIVLTEKALSTYLPRSELSRFNASESTDWIGVSSELCVLVDVALGLSEMTGGAFDVTVGPLVNLWGFGPDGGVTEPPAEQAIAAAREAAGYELLHTDCEQPALRKDRADLYVDLSGIAKGYAVDKVAHILNRREIRDYLVEIGGELKAAGKNASGADWAIAIEEPRLEGRAVQTIVGLSDLGMATSGDYRNFFRHEGTLYSHTIDPRSGWPTSHDGASVTVVADSTGFADAMATALLVLGPDDGIEFADRHAIAAYYLVRTGTGFDERRSVAFDEEVSLL